MSKKDLMRFYKGASKNYYNNLMARPYENYRNSMINKELILNFGSNNNTILDVGCGTGEFLIDYIKNRFRNSLIVCLDLSWDMLSVAKNKFNITCLNADAEYMPLSDKQFDLIIAREVLEHLSDPLKTLKEFRRVLKDNGNVVISTPSWFGLIAPFYFLKKRSGKMQAIDNWWTPFKLINIFKKAGFKIESCDTICFLPYHDFLPKFFVPIIVKIDKLLKHIIVMKYFGRIIVIKASKI